MTTATESTPLETPPNAAPNDTAGRSTSRIVANLTSNWGGIVVNILLSFFLAPLTVKVLGNVYYGVWAVLMQFTGYLWLFDFGVRESVVKYVAQYHAAGERGQLKTTVDTAVSLYTVVAVATLVGAAILALALPYIFNIPPDAVATARMAALLAGATVAQSFVFNVYVGVLMGLQRYAVMAQLGMVFGVVRALIILALLWSGHGILALAATQFLVTLASNLIVYWLCVRQLPYLAVRFTRPHGPEVKKLLHYGKYVLISNVGDKVVFATDSIVIGMFLPIASVAHFAIGGTLIDFFRTFMVSMGSMLNPLSSSLQARKESHKLGAVVMTGAKAAMILGVPICVGFIVLGTRFITLWMGAEYGPTAGLVLAVLAGGHMLGLPYYTISGVLYGLGRHSVVAYSRIFEAAVNLALSLLFVRYYGIAGVALGTVIPHVLVVGIVLPAVLPRMVTISIREYYISTYVWPFLASVPFWGACWFIETRVQPASLFTFLLSVGVALVTYVIPCWLLALSATDRAHVRHGIRSRLQPRLASA